MKENPYTDKQERRRHIRQTRRTMDEEAWRERSRSVCRIIHRTKAYQEAEILYAYLAVRGEVLLDELIEDALRAGKRVPVPRVEGENMVFCPIWDLEQVQVSPMGIREPTGEAERNENGNPKPREKILFLMPGIAFDRKGNRVGQGGGYYDRYLERNLMFCKVGAAFSFQMQEEVPTGALDIPVDAVASEDGLYGRGSSGERFTENYEFF